MRMRLTRMTGKRRIPPVHSAKQQRASRAIRPDDIEPRRGAWIGLGIHSIAQMI